ncbi:MAG: cysteine synthase [Fibrobacteria bacterium]|jgi:cysteine synthase A|nr:cysteine synthase [Fibrobacteria bacterium]
MPYAGVKFFEDMTLLTGRTPLVRLNKVVPHGDSLFLVKIEVRNPGGSLKDRIALNMIVEAEKQGKLKRGMTLIEPTSGNTGIALAWIAAVRGYKSILIMPESMSVERRNLLKAYGAELILTPSHQGMTGAIDKAKELLRTRKDCFMLQQFDNPANPDAHRKTTAEEIWEDTAGKIDLLVAGVGTGGFITGASSLLKSRRPSLRVVAVEPEASAVLFGRKPGWHDIQGIGAGFIPPVLDRKAYDEVMPVSNEAAWETCRRLAREEGILAGPSSGANVYALGELGKRPEFKGKVLVTTICDSGERYLSTPLYNQE